MSLDERFKNSTRMRLNNPMHNKDTVKKMVNTSRVNGNYSKFRERIKKQWGNQEFRDSQSYRMREFNPMFNPEVVKKSWVGHQRPKSGYEVKFEKMCEDKGLDIEFIGDGKLFVGTRNPDFIIPNTNKLVEIYSSTFKYGDTFRDSAWVNKTVDFYAQHGYKCICIDLDKKDSEAIYNEFSRYYHNGLKVESIRHYKRDIQVYNFSCHPYNTYLVDYMLVHNCDSPQTKKDLKRNSIDTLVKKAISLGIPYVCITGGEPLEQPDTVYPLVYELLYNNFDVAIETSGIS